MEADGDEIGSKIIVYPGTVPCLELEASLPRTVVQILPPGLYLSQVLGKV